MKIKNIFWIAFAIGIFGYFIYKLIHNTFASHLLGDEPQTTKAVIINEKNYMGNNTLAFNYSYKFSVNGVLYTGNSHDKSLKPGDSVEIEYNKSHPEINIPLHPKN